MQEAGVWDIFYARSTDNGDSWDFVYKQVSQIDDYNSQYPDVAAWENNVHIVWQDGYPYMGGWEIYYRRSLDNGNTLEAWPSYYSHMLSNDDRYRSEHPAIALHEEIIHVVWHDHREKGAYEIYYKRSPSNGYDWDDGISPPSTPSRLAPDRQLTTSDGSDSIYPDVAVFVDNIHVVWHDYRAWDTQIYYRRSGYTGVSWDPEMAIGGGPGAGSSYYASIAASGVNLHVVWQNYYAAGNYEIYYRRSGDNGSSWDGTYWGTRLTYDSAASLYARIATHDSKLSVVWQDERDGNWEIYYKYTVGSLSASPGPNTPSDHRRYYDPTAPPYNEMLQLELTAGSAEAVRIDSITLVASGTGNDSTGITPVLLVHDADGDGLYDTGETILATGTYPVDNGTLVLTIAGGHIIAAGTTDYLLVVYDINWAAVRCGDTFTFQVTAISATGVNSGQSIAVAGLPIQACIKTIVCRIYLPLIMKNY
jgi:hypothetical protein